MEEGKAYLSKEKIAELNEELKRLQTVRRKEIADQLEYSKSMGDLSENAEYHEAREDQAKNESRILQIEEILKNAVVLKHHSGENVDVGSTVTILKKGEETKHTYDIVGPEEADMGSGKLSYESPLGAALINKNKGDEFTFDSPKGKVQYKIVDVK
ncbi:transcription elongation factor GreA [Candidatus Nomurabacteria bacterium]|nr:transcription elongation factor GreA [Candidatus Nomurabacteria bacterium]